MPNPITDFPAFEFLLFYAILWTLIAALGWWLNLRADPTRSLPTLPVPSRPDPYEVAWLRGAEKEVGNLVVAGLLQRGFLQLDPDAKKTFLQAPYAPALEELQPVERSVFECFADSRTPAEAGQELTARIGSYCLGYVDRFRQEEFLASDEARRRAAWIAVVGVLVFAAVGGLRALVGLERERPIGLLLMAGVAGCFAIWTVCRPQRLSRRGRQYLKDLTAAFEGLKHANRISSLNVTSTGTAYSADGLLVAGVFGLSAAGFEDVNERLHPSSSAGGGCGGDGGCGGGCGGCG